MRLGTVLIIALTGIIAAGASAADRQAFFGDLHVHTTYSMDAFRFGTRTTPDDAYRFARGEAIIHPAGFEVQLDRPLDFYAVTDHAEFLGALASFNASDHPLHDQAKSLGLLENAVSFGGATAQQQQAAATAFVQANHPRNQQRSVWGKIVDAANRNYQPGKLTTFIGYEYTSFRDGGNLHRNVIFAGEKVPADIFGRLESFNPEDLWTWMDEQRDGGMEVLSIPHNSNGSDGWMFDTEQWDGSPIDRDYAIKRMRNEPIVEVTQVKGTSETHPFLSPNDEWADFEIFPYRVARWQTSRPRGSYVRDAYLTGLEIEARTGANPYRFGLVGASDTHNSGSRFDEEHFVGKVGKLDAFPERRGSVPVNVEDPVPAPAYRHVYRTYYSASGLTGVWANENTREDIYAALRRKETFATSGTRIRIRLFAGDLPADAHQREDWADLGYQSGVAQGSDLPAPDTAPRLLAYAVRDPAAAPLQRLQIIKGWIENNQKQERVYDVACSDGLEVDPNTARCPDNGATVELATCAITTDSGAAELSATWSDPDYDPTQNAFYYARALENPTCRWSTWDAVRAGVAPKPGHARTLQERAWTSPIWIDP